MLYALGGGLVGLLAWGVTAGDDDVAMGILQPSLGGTWVVTPEMLRGEEPIMFQGPTYERQSRALSLSAAAPFGYGARCAGRRGSGRPPRTA